MKCWVVCSCFDVLIGFDADMISHSLSSSSSSSSSSFLIRMGGGMNKGGGMGMKGGG